jgi:hypothetical protein
LPKNGVVMLIGPRRITPQPTTNQPAERLHPVFPGYVEAVNFATANTASEPSGPA